MIIALDPPAVSITGPRYYRWFASYEIPFRPVDPVVFAETEGLAGYYAAYHDLAGRVARFDKVRLVRVAKEPWTPAPSVAWKPGVAVYFTAVPDSSGEKREPGKQIAYAETEACDDFFVAMVEPSATAGTIARLRREIAFTDSYTYWPNGEMRTRSKTLHGQPSVHEQYDAAGTRISEGTAQVEQLDEQGLVRMK